MQVIRLANAGDAARAAADFVADCARTAIEERLRFTMALSGGSTPWQMLGLLAEEEIDWSCVHVFQVDERQAPDGDKARNFTHIQAQLLDKVPVRGENIHAMPVNASTLQQGARDYERTLEHVAGRPVVLDLVHLGVGSDGHTASLLPGDALLGESMADVGVTPVYQGHPRMSLTYPAIDRARHILWLVNGADKSEMLQKVIEGDGAIPAGRVRQARATVITDIPGG